MSEKPISSDMMRTMFGRVDSPPANARHQACDATTTATLRTTADNLWSGYTVGPPIAGILDRGDVSVGVAAAHDP